MARHTEIVESLRAMGHRITPQRVMVLSAMAHQPGHVGVEEIFQEVSRLYPYIDLATVYRTLHWLKRLHLVTELVMGGTARYELVAPETEPHHHMVCRSCGGAFDLSPRYLEEFRTTLRREFGFEPDVENFAIGGVCASCAVSRARL